jgi:hypothetical protein
MLKIVGRECCPIKQYPPCIICIKGSCGDISTPATNSKEDFIWNTRASNFIIQVLNTSLSEVRVSEEDMYRIQAASHHLQKIVVRKISKQD